MTQPNQDDYGTKQPSPREMVAREMAETIIELGLTKPLGGEVQKAETNRFWFVLFSLPANLDGQVTVFSDQYIRVTWTTRFQDLPHEGKMQFDNVEFAKMFMRLAFVQHKGDEAMALPQWQPKRKPKPKQPESDPQPSNVPEEFDEDHFTTGDE